MKVDNRTTELIALGASVAAHCQSCLEYHVAKALEYGVDQEEIAQALEIGRTVRMGAAAKIDKLADSLLRKEPVADATGAKSAAAPASEAGCCAPGRPWSWGEFPFHAGREAKS